jgi:LacI family transcriptional regulator
LLDLKLPLIFFDRVREDVPTTRIVTNDFESGYTAVKHLVSRGCKRIAFLSAFGDLDIIRYRQQGYYKGLEDHGLDLSLCHTVRCVNNDSENLEIVKALLTRENRPDAIIGSIEKVTMHAYTVCHALHLSIPNDVKIIGFSHLQIASLLNPSLTTVAQPAFEMGKVAARVLFKALGKKMDVLKNEQIVIPSFLIERSSTQASE